MPPLLIRSPKLPATPYAHASVAPELGPLVLTAGACPLGPDGEVVGAGDVVAQAVAVMRNLAIALEAAGSSLQLIAKTTIYVAAAEQRDLGRVWGVVAGALAPHEPPSTLLGVGMLGYAGQLVEVEAIALRRGDTASRSLLPAPQAPPT